MENQSSGKVIPFHNPFIMGLFGPAIILLAFGQATGELIHWPYLSIKYGLFFYFLLFLPLYYNIQCLVSLPDILFYPGRPTF